MKIFIDCRFWGEKYTGLGRYTENLVTNLLSLDSKNLYLLLFRADNYKNAQVLKSAQVNIIIGNFAHYSLAEQIKLPLLLYQLKPDLVHFTHFNIPLGFRGKFVVTIHDLIKHYSKGMETTTRHPLIYFSKYLGYKIIFNQAIQSSLKIIVPTKCVKNEILKLYKINKDKICITYEGVDDKFSIQKKNDGILSKYGIHKPYIIYVGNAYPHKNLRNLILAMKLINNSSQHKSTNRRNNIQLVISCARDVFWHRLEKEIKELRVERWVKLTGFVPDDDLSVLYSQAKAFVTPSLMEGFGLPALEAMSRGCPVVCSDIPVFREIYDQAAIYFNPQDLGDISAKITQVLTLPPSSYKFLINRGKTQVQKYSWEELAKKTLKIYESCLSL